MAVVINQSLSLLLTPEGRRELRKMNIQMTKRALNLCSLNSFSLANQFLQGTQSCLQLAVLKLHGLNDKHILTLAKKYNVLYPWSFQYGSQRFLMNQRFVSFPLIIVYPETKKDVSFFISFCRKYEFKLGIRSGGHCFENFPLQCEIILDTSFLTLDVPKACCKNYVKATVKLDCLSNIVHVSPGARLGVIYNKLNKYGLTIPAGICPSVGIGGYASSGLGYWVRKYGYLCDNITEYEIAIADGSVIKLNSNQNTDLFRAYKGAGNGNFGVLTRISIQAYHHPKVTFFNFTYNNSDAVSVAIAWQSFIQTAPNDMAGSILAPLAGLPTFSINGIFSFADQNRAHDILKSHFTDLIPEIQPTDSKISVLPYPEVQTLFSLEVPPFPFSKVRSNYYFEPISPIGIATLFNLFTNPIFDITRGIGACQILSFGGAASQVPEEDSVIPVRKAIAWIQYVSFWNDQADTNTALSFVNNVYDQMQAFVSPFAYFNYPDSELVDYLYQYFGNNVDFLQQVKVKYDPTNFFNYSQSIPLP